MLDIDVIRADPEKIRDMLVKRNKGTEILDRLMEADNRWRDLVSENNQLRKTRNEVSQVISKLPKGEEKDAKIKEMRAVGDKIKANDDEMAKLEEVRNDCLLNIPNIPDASVPLGKDDTENVVSFEWGEKRKFDFTPKDHAELMLGLGIVDFERATKITGSGFYCLKGDGARLERALICFFLDTHRQQGYKEVFTPVIVNKAAVTGTGQYPNLADDMYYLEKDDMFLNPTAEVPVTNLLQGEILAKEDLPIKLTAYLPSFRREVGKHADTAGILRVHQFNKVEMVRFELPEDSWQALEDMRHDAEELLQKLGLPYHVLTLCTGDMSFSCAKCYDLEVWAPAHERWLECSSCSNDLTFQARRARIKYRPEPHMKSEFVHTLNGSGLALPRTMAAILENYQNADGSVTIPEVLRPYMGGQEKLVPPEKKPVF
ncbi:MAG: serine--tRNA ligase [Thermoplasmata archaeon]|nr:serine--tRNA ligase [Thermoplasmata archaeon]